MSRKARESGDNDDYCNDNPIDGGGDNDGVGRAQPRPVNDALFV